MKQFFAAIASLCLSACAPAQLAPAPPAGSVPEMSLETLKVITKTLSRDDFGGRAPGSAGEEKTLSYLVQAFDNVGLEPGNRGGWFQDVPLAEITAKKVSPLTVSGGSEVLDFAFGSEFIGGTYRLVPQIDIAGSELVFVGYGIHAPEKGWNDYSGLDMRGKTAVILVNDPDYQSEGVDGRFNGRAMTYYGRWTYKYAEAARQGADAALIIHDTFPAGYGWNVVESSGKGPQAFAASGDGNAGETKFNGWIKKQVAARMLSAAGQDLAALSAAAKQPGFKPVPLGLKADLSVSNTLRTFNTKNVIGMLRGRNRPDEYVIYTAHWDHLGHCAADEADTICNGAIDNASGIAGLVALADAFKRGGAPDRSVLFLAVGAEESGLLGSQYYAANPVFPLAQTVGGLNMDSLSLAGRARDVRVIGEGKSQLDSYLAEALKAVGRYQTPDATPEKGFYYRSDHFSFAKRGVPMLFVDYGLDLVAGGRKAGEAYFSNYNANIYHSPRDEFSESWDWSGAMDDLTLYYLVGRSLAQSKAWPNWYEGDEFRAIRDASCAGAGGC